MYSTAGAGLMKHRGLRAALGAVACIFLGLQALSQTAGTGNIQGAISDTTGSVIQNAIVVVINTATEVKHQAETDASGLYSFPNLPIGTYEVDVSKAGFQQYRQSNIVLDVGSSIAVNVHLKVGSRSETIEVQASGLALQTEDSSLKQTVDEKTISEMPLNGRRMTDLVTLMGGAVNANENNDVQGSKTFYSSAVISIAGGQGNFTDYRLDGGDNNDYMTNINLPFPFPDAVAQFSVETTDLTAQSGLHPGGLVNVVTRSGTNQWHGSAFEFIRNNIIDATNFFSTSKDSLHQNQYGGTFGGRIVPNRLFFFAGYQRTTAEQSQSLTKAYVPTAANLAGDFSATDGPGCNPVQLVNPVTGALLPNNRINPSYFDPAALALEKYLPKATNACGLVTYAIPNRIAENQFVTRVDATINQKHSLYGRYYLDGYQHPSFFSPTNVLITNSTGNYERVQGLTLGETWVVSPRLVNTFHATGTRRDIRRGPATNGINPATLGLNMYSTAPVGFYLSVANKWKIYSASGAPAIFNQNTFSYADDVNWMHGKHQMAFGGEYVRSQFNENNVYQGNGSFTFSGQFGQFGPNGQSVGGTGEDANLDFLTGSMSDFQQSSAQLDALRAPIPSLYIMDTYHATGKLVLTAGVRWDPQYFPTDYFGRGSTFSMTDFLSNTVSQVYPHAAPGSLYYGDRGVPRAFTKNSIWQFSPRIGVTYDPTGKGKTVLRAGGAIVFDTVDFFMGQNMNENPPFSQSIDNVPVNAPLSFRSPWSTGTVTNNPFPLSNHPSSSTVIQPDSQYIELPAHYKPPAMFQYTVSLQQEFGRGWQAQIDYVGNRTDFNSYSLPMSPAVYIPGMCGGAPCSTLGNTPSRFALTLANPSGGPYYSGGGQGSVYVVTGANASYNGMIATIQHRLSSNFVLMSNYAWSHCIDIADNVGDTEAVTVQNPANIKGDRGNCGFDYRHVFNASLVATSHFHLSGWLDEIVNRWEIAPLVHATDGAPFTVLSGVDNSLTDIGNDRPDLVNAKRVYTHAKIRSGDPSNAQYINPAAFTQNPTGTFGDVARNQFRGPKFLQTDCALTREFPLRESLALNFRFEAFNLLNHPNFATPESDGYIGETTSLSSGTFGEITSTPYNYGARIFQGAAKFTF